MSSKIPSDSLIRFHIQNEIRNAPDAEVLTRNMIKDSIATRFNLSIEDRKRLSEEDHFKRIIKIYCKEVMAELEDGKVASVTSAMGESENKPMKTPQKIEKSNQQNTLSKQSIASRSSLSGKPESSEKHIDIKRKVDSDSMTSNGPKISQKHEKRLKQKERESTLSEFSSLEDSDDDKKKKKSQSRPKKKSRSSTNSDSSSRKPASHGSKDGSEKLEAKLKKWKKLVVLCGTRRIWKRLFEDAGCPDLEDDEEKVKVETLKKQIEVVEEALKDLGMTPPFTQAKADAIREQKELEEELEVIKKAGTTEKSKTRSAKSDKTRGREAPVDVESGDESDAKYRPSPPLKKFRNDLASFADELNS